MEKGKKLSTIKKSLEEDFSDPSYDWEDIKKVLHMLWYDISILRTLSNNFEIFEVSSYGEDRDFYLLKDILEYYAHSWTCWPIRDEDRNLLIKKWLCSKRTLRQPTFGVDVPHEYFEYVEIKIDYNAYVDNLLQLDKGYAKIYVLTNKNFECDLEDSEDSYYY